MSTRCLICGAGECDGHHATGRAPNGRYLDPDVKLPLCHDHHELVGDDWRTLGVGDRKPRNLPKQDLSLIEQVELRLRRAAVVAGRLAAEHPDWPWLAALARALKRWADELARHIAAQDRRDPDWRTDSGFYPTTG
jgi:hypothetical protein